MAPQGQCGLVGGWLHWGRTNYSWKYADERTSPTPTPGAPCPWSYWVLLLPSEGLGTSQDSLCLQARPLLSV